MKFTTSLIISLLFLQFTVVSPTNAGIVFDGSFGTNAPAAFVGPYLMTPFAPDTRPYGSETQVFTDASQTTAIDFSAAAGHTAIGVGWATWSHGYLGMFTL